MICFNVKLYSVHFKQTIKFPLLTVTGCLTGCLTKVSGLVAVQILVLPQLPLNLDQGGTKNAPVTR